MKIIIIIALALLLPTVALAQRQTFKDASGRTLGRSVTDARGNTTYYDAMGKNTGRSTTNNGTMTIYDNAGRQTGTISKGR